MLKLAASLIVDNVPPVSDLKIVNQLARLYQDNACDSIIAVGGGSVMDTPNRVNPAVLNPPASAGGGMRCNTREVALL